MVVTTRRGDGRVLFVSAKVYDVYRETTAKPDKQTRSTWCCPLPFIGCLAVY